MGARGWQVGRQVSEQGWQRPGICAREDGGPIVPRGGSSVGRHRG